MYSEDSVICCLFPNKCNIYSQTPVLVKTVLWYLSTAIVTCCLVEIVWLGLRMVHRYTTNEIVCKYVCAENHVDTVTANENGKPSSLFLRDEKTLNDDLANSDVRQSVKNDSSNEMYSTRMTDTDDESMVPSTDSEHKGGYADHKMNPYSFKQDLDDDLGMPYLSVFKQSEVDYKDYWTFGDSNRSSEKRTNQNYCNDNKQCCVLILNKCVSKLNEEQCCNNNDDIQLCQLANDTIIPTVFAKELKRIITYKSPDSFKCYLRTSPDKQQ